MAVTITPGKSNLPLFENYKEWNSLSNDEREELYRELKSSASRLWLTVCRRAVESMDVDWLRTFADPEIPDYLPWPFSRWSPADRLNKKKYLAISLANCGLAAIERKRNRGAYSSEFGSLVLKAVYFRRKAIDASASPPTIGACSSVNDVFQNLAGSDVDSESIEVELLINYLTSPTDLWADIKEMARTRFPVVIGRTHGRVCELRVRRIRNGSGRLFCDSFEMSMTPIDRKFRIALGDALTLVRKQYGINPNIDFCWSIYDSSGQLAGFDGPSIGLAAAMAFRQVATSKPGRLRSLLRRMREKFLDSYTAYTGEIDATGSVKPVGGYIEKIETMDRIYTLFVPEADFDKLTSFQADGRKIQPAHSLVQVADESRNILLKRIRLVLGVVSAVLVLPLITVAAVYWGHVQSLAAAAAEDRAIAERKEKWNSELEAQNLKRENEIKELEKQNLKRENAAKELQAQNAKKDRDLAIREKDLANRQSAILSEKNKELDVARRNEESQRKLAEKNENEAKLQRSVAERNEETARAFEQVAKANQLAYQGLSFLNDKDYVSAQTFFAQSLSYNDTLLARSGLVNATYRSPLPQEFNWSLEQRMTSSRSGIEVGAEVYFYRFTSDRTGKYFAYLSDRKEISLRKVQSKEEIAKVVADGKEIDAISLSPEGKFLGIGTSDGDVFLRDVLSQKQEKILTLDKARTGPDRIAITALAFSSDSTYLALATAEPQIVVIDVRQRTIVNSFPKLDTDADDLDIQGRILNLAFNSSAGLAFSTVDEDLDSKIGFIPNVQKDTALTASSERLVTNLSFTNDREIISSGMGWQTWLLANGEIKRDKSEDFTAHVQTHVAANPHFDYFVSAGEDGKLKIWNSSDKRLIAQISPSMGKPTHVAIGDNGAALIQSVTGDGKLRIFSWSFGQKVNSHRIPAEAVIGRNQEFVSHTGNYIKFDCAKRLLQIQNYFTGKTFLSLQYDTSKDLQQLIITPRLSRDGARLLVKRVEAKVSGGSEERLSVYDLASLQSTEIDLSKYRGPTFPDRWQDFCFEDGRSGASAVGNPRTILGSDDHEYLSDDGKTIAAQIRDKAVGVFSVSGQRAPITVIPNNLWSATPVPIGERPPSVFSISSNSRILVTSVPTVLDMLGNKKYQSDSPAKGDNSFQLYDIQTGELKEQIPSPEMLSGYSLSPDGRFFAVTDLDGYASIWTLVPYLRLLDVLKVGKYERALSPSFSQDGSLLAWISGGTGRIHFYDLRAQRRLGDLQTDDLIMDIGFVNANTLSIYTADELRSVDLNNLPMILAQNALESKTYIHARNNLYLDEGLVTGFLYDQPRLDSILKASKYSMVSPPSVRGRAKHSAEITEFDREGIAINQGFQTPNRQGTSDCNPIFSQPIFNPYPITFNDDRPACGHYALIDIRNASRGERYSRDQKAWESVRQVKPGEVYYGLIYMSNGAAEDLDEATIHNLRARVTINYGQTGNNFIKGELLADNAMPLDAALPLDTSKMRPVVGNTIEIYDYQIKLLKTINVSDFVHLEGGQKMSFEIPIGELKPGFTTDLFIRFKFFFEDASKLPDQRADKYTGIITDGDITKLERSFSKSNIGCSPRSFSAVFNPFRVSFNDSNEECTDFPLIQGRLIGGTYPQNVQELGDGLTGHDGDIVEMLIYFDNGASEGLDRQKNAVKGFKVAVMVDTLPGPTHTVTATLRADDALSLSRSIAIRTDASEQLEIIPKSGVVYDFQKNPVQSGFDVGNNLISMQNLLPGFGHSGFIGFRIKIVPKDTRLVASCDRAVMSGSVQIGDPGTSAWFEWGETRELGKLTAKKLFNEDAEDSQEITGLAPNTTYYYRAVARSGNRRAAGEIRSFRTPACTK